MKKCKLCGQIIYIHTDPVCIKCRQNYIDNGKFFDQKNNIKKRCKRCGRISYVYSNHICIRCNSDINLELYKKIKIKPKLPLKKTDRTINKLLTDYTIRINKYLAKNTAFNYNKSVEDFIKFTGPITPDKITERLVNEQYLNNLKLKGYSLVFIFIKLQHLRFFLEYLRSEGIRTLNPSLIIDNKIKTEAGLRSNRIKGNLLTIKELDLMKKYWKKNEYASLPRGLRNQVLIQILIDAGLTTSELTFITRDDVDIKKSIININHYKNREKYKNRILNLSGDTVFWINRFFDIREDKSQCMIVRFKAREGFIVQAWPLTTKSISDIVGETARNIGIKKKVTPRAIRNSLIFNNIKEGKNKDQINYLFGFYPTSRRYYYKRYSDLNN